MNDIEEGVEKKQYLVHKIVPYFNFRSKKIPVDKQRKTNAAIEKSVVKYCQKTLK